MKQLSLQPHSIIILILLFHVSGAYSQAERSNLAVSIYPSVQFQIQKADPAFLKDFDSAKPGNHESELTEKFSTQNRRIPREVEKDVVNNSFHAVEIMAVACPPLVQTSFEGNRQAPYYLFPYYGPSECDIAISDAGKMVSISSGWMYYFIENGALVFSDTLYHFGNGLNDCHVLYDPKADRFVFSAQYGYYNAIPFIFNVYGTVIGFSKSNNPMDGWYLYQLPFTDFHDNSEGDYPLIAISNDEIFITLDYYNAGNRYKHVEIIQVNKREGYADSTSLTSQKYDAPLNGNTKGTMVPAQGGSTTYGPKMYFIMANESGNSSNKYYVYEITNTMASGQAMLNRYGPVTSNISYSACGTSYQFGGIPLVNLFADNDAFMQDAFFENGVLQFCQHTNVNGKASICLGRITGIPDNLTCTAKTISDPGLYLSFPSIAYSGNSSSDNSAIVGIEHTGVTIYPGLSAVYVTSDFEVSALTTVKTGNDTINALWGDYSGICRRYNHPGEVWFEGQYGSTVFPAINWIAKLNKPNSEGQSIASSPEADKLNQDIKVYPNPFSNYASISFTIEEPQDVSLKIFDASGTVVKILLDDKVDKGNYSLKWDRGEIEPGIYFLQFVTGDHLVTKEISVIN